MPGKVSTGPGKPTHMSQNRERVQRSAKRYEGTYTKLDSSAMEAGAIQRGGRMTTHADQKGKGSATQQFRQNKGRQGPI